MKLLSPLQAISKSAKLAIIALLAFLPVRAQLNTDRITDVGRNALYFEDYVLAIQHYITVGRTLTSWSNEYVCRA